VLNIITRLFWGSAPTRFESATNSVPFAYARALAPPSICGPGVVFAYVKEIWPIAARAAWPLLKFCAFSSKAHAKTHKTAMYFLNIRTPGESSV